MESEDCQIHIPESGLRLPAKLIAKRHLAVKETHEPNSELQPGSFPEDVGVDEDKSNRKAEEN